MAASLVFAPEVEHDISEAFLWYEERRIGLGEEFLSAVDACVESIRRNPMICARVHENYRRCLTRRFPYAVFYVYEGEVVTIFAVMHTSRDPQRWRQRLP